MGRKMKIGIITLSASYNCGSMLQSYALKEILSEYGTTEIINFSSEASHRVYDILPTTFLGKIHMIVKCPKMFYELKNEKKAYEIFKRNILGIDSKERFASDLCEITDKYDVVVAGSDQIWNVCMGDFDEAFLCGWTNKRKIAYAPSLGGHDIRESSEAIKYINELKQFERLSAREEKGRNCLEEITGRTVPVVLDPTLVYEKANWCKLVGQPLVKGKYIFYYSWAYCEEELRKIVSKRSEEMGIPVYVIDARKWREHRYSKDNFVLCKQAGPMAFLNLMFYAKECYVESFHGMIFAYIFKKKFWLLDTHEDYEKMDTRLRELIEVLNVRERVLTPYNKENTDMEKNITYRNNEEIQKKIKLSRTYLDNSLKKENSK